MSIKQDRIAGRIRQILSQLLLREISDPRLLGLTITEVEIDTELTFARVYVNALGEEERQAEILAALAKAKGFLRKELGKRVRLRTTPDMGFYWDARYDRADQIEELLASLHIPPPDDIPAEEVPADDDSVR
ncbi:MAG: 30S ribosome-binding factor RbfA [Pleurocapsa minor GSE-CHR-MK-17-07R]|jgi:ribosome-binding factor A|nr:30S ribosome-binding factor RbfA [Pleurocapsa minor GSE-CHR-MK 17-07R]